MSTITADDLRVALKDTYSSPEWYLGFEVGNSTGSNCRRYADAVAINAYPSKGFEIRGFEIKVSKSDLKKELEEGAKADAIAKFCDYWFLVVPKGLTDTFTIPKTWGVIEYNNGTLRQKIKAEKLTPEPPTVGFLCAMLRGRERILNSTISELAKKEAESMKKYQSYEVQRDKKELDDLRKKLKEIGDQTGIYLDSWMPEKHIINRLNAAQNIEIIAESVSRLGYAIKRMETAASAISKAANNIMAEEGSESEK